MTLTINTGACCCQESGSGGEVIVTECGSMPATLVLAWFPFLTGDPIGLDQCQSGQFDAFDTLLHYIGQTDICSYVSKHTWRSDYVDVWNPDCELYFRYRFWFWCTGDPPDCGPDPVSGWRLGVTIDNVDSCADCQTSVGCGYCPDVFTDSPFYWEYTLRDVFFSDGGYSDMIAATVIVMA